MKSKTIPALVDKKRLITARECSDIQKHIFSLRRQWMKSRHRHPYYSLFGSCVLNLKQNSWEKYSRDAKQFNPVLLERFPELYERLFARLSHLLEAPVAPHPEFSLPGFVVHLVKKGIFVPPGVPHFDVQHRLLDWSKVEGARPAETASFTLPIALPACGTGLECWSVDYFDFLTRPKTPLATQLERSLRKFYHYSQGHLFLMKGLFAHRVPSPATFEENEMRITLQGHAIRTKSGWLAYW